MTAAALLESYRGILTGMKADELPEAELLLNRIIGDLRSLPPAERQELEPSIRTCIDLTRTANQFWERQRASLNANTTSGYAAGSDPLPPNKPHFFQPLHG
ncbi:MAG: hypothetical protein H7Y20_16865 [Bryobacteraceae bacterium]|nr:hypothetical protein [Bryobacteraceae bacterium]